MLRQEVTRMHRLHRQSEIAAVLCAISLVSARMVYRLQGRGQKVKGGDKSEGFSRGYHQAAGCRYIYQSAGR